MENIQKVEIEFIGDIANNLNWFQNQFDNFSIKVGEKEIKIQSGYLDGDDFSFDGKFKMTNGDELKIYCNDGNLNNEKFTINGKLIKTSDCDTVLNTFLNQYTDYINNKIYKVLGL